MEGLASVLAVRAFSDSRLTRHGAATSLLVLFTGRSGLVSGVGEQICFEGWIIFCFFFVFLFVVLFL